MNIKQITIGLSIGAILGILSPFSAPILAQKADDLGSFPSNERDPDSTGLGGNINPMQLMHQLQLNNGRNMSEFLTESNRNIDSASSDFKKQQQERILQQTSAKPDNNLEETAPKN